MALPGYLEDTAKDYAKQSTATYSAPIDTSKFTGQTVCSSGEDPLQTSNAINLAQHRALDLILLIYKQLKQSYHCRWGCWSSFEQRLED